MKRLENKERQDERNEEYDKAVALQQSLLTDAWWPQDLFVEVVDVGSSISYIIPPDSVESASDKVYLLLYPTVCHWNDLSGPFRPICMVVSPLTGGWEITVNLTNVIAEGNCSISNYDELMKLEALRALGALISINISGILKRRKEIKVAITEDFPDIDDRVSENYGLLLAMGEEVSDKCKYHIS